MKKVIAILLIVAMCLPVIACGKSKEAAAVDEMILAIGEIDTNSRDEIIAIEEAYNALSDEDKAAVENYELLAEAKFALLVEDMIFFNDGCDMLSSFIYMMWDNVGPSNLATCLGAVLRFEDENSINEVKFAVVAVAGMALGYDNLSQNDTATVNKVVEMCISFTDAFQSVDVIDTQLKEDVATFIDMYSDVCPEEAELLNAWYIDSSLFAEFTVNPSGSLMSYGSELSEYRDTLSRFQKEAESLM